MNEGGAVYPLYAAGKSSVVSVKVALSSATALSVSSGTDAGSAAEAAELAAAAELPSILKVNIERVSAKCRHLILFPERARFNINSFH